MIYFSGILQLSINPSVHAGLQSVIWSPLGSSLAYVYENDVYYKSSPYSEPTRVTHTGATGEILNGVPDWMYQGNGLLHSIFCKHMAN